MVRFAGGVSAAEFQQRLTPRLGGNHSSAHAVFNMHLEIALHLRGELDFAASLVEQTAEPHQPRAQHLHDFSFLAERKRARMAVACSQSRVSFLSWFLPERVSR